MRIENCKRFAFVDCIANRCRIRSIKLPEIASHRSIPAQAIIMPLSVHNAGLGHISCRPARDAIRSSRLLRCWFAATPPDTTKCFTFGLSSCAQVMPRSQRSTMWATATLWKDAAISALACRTAVTFDCFLTKHVYQRLKHWILLKLRNTVLPDQAAWLCFHESLSYSSMTAYRGIL